MKRLGVCILIFAAVVVTPSQEPASGQDPPDLIIIKQTWGKESALRDWDSPPYSAAPERRGARPGGVGQRPHDPDSLSTRRWPAPALKNYVYKALVKNAGNREIQAVRWVTSSSTPARRRRSGATNSTAPIKSGLAKKYHSSGPRLLRLRRSSPQRH